MKWLQAVPLLALVVLAFGDDLPLAEPCDEDACNLPDCRCTSTDIPGGLEPRDTPQFVMLTWDDGVNIINIETYREMLYGRINKNNCPVGVTYFVNHEYTNYVLVNELYNQGFEIALHSISHQANQAYWQQADYDDMMREFGDQRSQMSHFANVPYDELKGVRIPFLQMTGNSSFQVMADVGLLYDSSWPTITSIDPGLWPYTLHYESTQDCHIGPCPTASIPGPWVIPMVSWIDINGTPCSMVDSCFAVPDLNDEDAWFSFIVENFERHYLGNRAPFGFYIHEWYIATYSGPKGGLRKFLDMINNLNDVFMVNSADVIDWVKSPVPINEYVQRPCNVRVPATCSSSSCGPLSASHTESTLYKKGTTIWENLLSQLTINANYRKQNAMQDIHCTDIMLEFLAYIVCVIHKMQYWMQICNVCPATYPWLGNPLGLATS